MVFQHSVLTWQTNYSFFPKVKNKKSDGRSCKQMNKTKMSGFHGSKNKKQKNLFSSFSEWVSFSFKQPFDSNRSVSHSFTSNSFSWHRLLFPTWTLSLHSAVNRNITELKLKECARPEQTGPGQTLQCSVWAERHLQCWQTEPVEESRTCHWETHSLSLSLRV